jgi:hypothetical protein
MFPRKKTRVEAEPQTIVETGLAHTYFHTNFAGRTGYRNDRVAALAVPAFRISSVFLPTVWWTWAAIHA